MSAFLGALCLFVLAVVVALALGVGAAGLLVLGYLAFAKWVGAGHDF